MKLPAGYQAGAVACGLKPSGKPDLALLVSDRPAAAVGVFTANRFQAAPVVVAKRLLRRGTARAIVVNAGNANACTGPEGIADATRMGELTAAAAGVKASQVLVSSTGVIGQRLDMDAVARGIGEVAPQVSPAGASAFAEAIMTTDTIPKTAEAAIGGATLLGVAKGAGMMAPEMATMLAFLVTDAAVERSVLADALRRGIAGTFNALSLDGCMSTNDTVLLLANGASGEPPIGPAGPRAAEVARAVEEVCASLARQIADDGEGATKVATITVRGAATDREARAAARGIADSVLLRCALNGGDPYWGRVLAALGATRIPLDPHRVDVWMGGEQLAAGGTFGPGDQSRARAAMQGRDIAIEVDLHRGDRSASLLTNDLSVEYVRFNTEYTT